MALPVVRAFAARVKERALSSEVSGALNPGQQVVKIVHEELIDILGGQTRPLQFAKTGPTFVLLTGLQGAGKTTLAGKLAAHLKAEGHTPLLVAADLQRPNAVDQLRVMGERADVPVFAPEPGNGVGDPVQVARESRRHAEGALHDVVIVDTAGRLAIDAELMDELRRVRDAVQPENVLLVVDAMIGQDAVDTAKTFDEEKKVAEKAPVAGIKIDNIGDDVKSEEVSKDRIFAYSIKIADFYYKDSARNMISRIINETNVKNPIIQTLSKTKYRVLLGPFNDIKKLEESFNEIKSLNFENIEILKDV